MCVKVTVEFRRSPRVKNGALILLVALCLSPGWHVSAWAAKPSPTDLLSRSEYNNVVISPTGEYMAITKFEGETARFLIYKMPERKLLVSTELGTRFEAARMAWASDHHMVVAPARRMFEDVKGITGELISINAKTGREQWLRLEDCEFCGISIVHTLPDDPEHIVVAASSHQFNEAHRVNVINGRFRRITKSPVRRSRFVADPSGKIAFAIGTNAQFAQEVHLKRGNKWELLETSTFGTETWTPFANGPATDTYLTWDSRGGGTRGLGLFDVKTRAHRMLYQFDEVDVGSVYRDAAYRVYAVRTDLHFPAIHYLNDSHPLARIRQNLSRSYPEDFVFFTSATRDNTQVIALVQGDRNPGKFILVDMKTKTVEDLFAFKPNLSREMLAPVTPIEIKARDGSTVYGYLTSAAETARPGPMIVYVHGGPHGPRDYWGYDPAVQLMAANGAHVLQVNFRGSGGYGLEYEKAGYGEWGGLMQDDLTDATRWAIAAKVADPARICIFGGSYGAYAALMGAVQEPDLYRCAVGTAGIYDLTIMDSKGDVSDSVAGIAYLREILGDDEDALKVRSPVHQADRIKASVMLVHGGRDRRAPIAHAQRMRKALQAAGQEVVWLTDGRQGHGFAGVTAQVELYEQIGAFLSEHLELDVSVVE